MMNKRSLLKATVVAVAVAWSGTTLAQDKPIKVGVTAGPHAQIFEQVKKVAARDGLKVEIIEFSDYVQPNAALAAGDLDATAISIGPTSTSRSRIAATSWSPSAAPSTSRSASTRRKSSHWTS